MNSGTGFWVAWAGDFGLETGDLYPAGQLSLCASQSKADEKVVLVVNA
jgi:hypothetical protein